jgi:hypothetical protein
VVYVAEKEKLTNTKMCLFIYLYGNSHITLNCWVAQNWETYLNGYDHSFRHVHDPCISAILTCIWRFVTKYVLLVVHIWFRRYDARLINSLKINRQRLSVPFCARSCFTYTVSSEITKVGRTEIISSCHKLCNINSGLYQPVAAYSFKCWYKLSDSHTYKVVQIWPGQTVTCLHTSSPCHIWTTLYNHIMCCRMQVYVLSDTGLCQ